MNIRQQQFLERHPNSSDGIWRATQTHELSISQHLQKDVYAKVDKIVDPKRLSAISILFTAARWSSRSVTINTTLSAV